MFTPKFGGRFFEYDEHILQMGCKLVYVVDPDSWICLVDNVFYGFYQDFPSRNEKIHLLRWFFGIEVQQIQGLMVCFCHFNTFKTLLPFADEVPAQRTEIGAPQINCTM